MKLEELPTEWLLVNDLNETSDLGFGFRCGSLDFSMDVIQNIWNNSISNIIVIIYKVNW